MLFCVVADLSCTYGCLIVFPAVAGSDLGEEHGELLSQTAGFGNLVGSAEKE